MSLTLLPLLLQVCGGRQQSDLHAAGRQHGLGGEGLPGGPGALRGRHRGGTGVSGHGCQKGRCQIQAAEPGQQKEQEEGGQQEAGPGGQPSQPTEAGAVMEPEAEEAQIALPLTAGRATVMSMSHSEMWQCTD